MLFVEQVGEINLRESDGQIFRQCTNLQRIQRDVDGRVLVLVVERKENNMLVKSNGGVDVLVSDAVEERAHGLTSLSENGFVFGQGLPRRDCRRRQQILRNRQGKNFAANAFQVGRTFVALCDFACGSNGIDEPVT